MAQQAEVGYASWYNRGFHGLSTASGEAYDHEALTAAHPSLPFGTMIRVTRTDDGRSVIVRINDRMQSGPGHVLDLSGAAARELGMLETGVTRVRIAEGQAPATAATVTPASTSVAPSGASFTLQLGVFSSRASAQAQADRHSGSWIQAVQGDSGTMYRVYYKGYDSETAARSEQQRLYSTGVESFLRALR